MLQIGGNGGEDLNLRLSWRGGVYGMKKWNTLDSKLANSMMAVLRLFVNHQGKQTYITLP